MNRKKVTGSQLFPLDSPQYFCLRMMEKKKLRPQSSYSLSDSVLYVYHMHTSPKIPRVVKHSLGGTSEKHAHTQTRTCTFSLSLTHTITRTCTSSMRVKEQPVDIPHEVRHYAGGFSCSRRFPWPSVPPEEWRLTSLPACWNASLYFPRAQCLRSSRVSDNNSSTMLGSSWLRKRRALPKCRESTHIPSLLFSLSLLLMALQV